eukprot:SAG31_NODE_478_length_15144_cov_15.165769_12_plen_198_part_00
MKLAGADRLSFPPIVAGGDRALTLHYVKNDCRLAAGELVLVDAGAELGGYCSDVSRTWPVSGTYTTGQRKLYDLVLETNVQVIEELRRAAGRETQPATLRSLHSLSVRILTDGLLELGLLQDDTGSSSRAAAVTELVRREAHRRFYPHSVRVVTFSFLCPLLEKYGTFIARCNALIEKVSSFRLGTTLAWTRMTHIG